MVIKHGVEFGCLKVVNPMSYLTVGLLENTSRLVDVSLNCHHYDFLVCLHRTNLYFLNFLYFIFSWD